jgi:hypothetical protein
MRPKLEKRADLELIAQEPTELRGNVPIGKLIEREIEHDLVWLQRLLQQRLDDEMQLADAGRKRAIVSTGARRRSGLEPKDPSPAGANLPCRLSPLKNNRDISVAIAACEAQHTRNNTGKSR